MPSNRNEYMQAWHAKHPTANAQYKKKSRWTRTPEKVCVRCGESKPRSEFPFKKRTCDACNECQAIPPEQLAWERHIRHSYGISAADYARMLERQHGLCAICKQPEPTINSPARPVLRRLSVDHDHELGAVRSLLCSSCNQGIGFFKHNPALLAAAIEYLRQPRLL